MKYIIYKFLILIFCLIFDMIVLNIFGYQSFSFLTGYMLWIMKKNNKMLSLQFISCYLLWFLYIYITTQNVIYLFVASILISIVYSIFNKYIIKNIISNSILWSIGYSILIYLSTMYMKVDFIYMIFTAIITDLLSLKADD
jgi:hypothetical protein